MFSFLCFQAEDGIRDLVRSRGLGDVYKRQVLDMLDKLARNEPEKYQTFWKEFGSVIKEGPAEDLSLIHI